MGLRKTVHQYLDLANSADEALKASSDVMANKMTKSLDKSGRVIDNSTKSVLGDQIHKSLRRSLIRQGLKSSGHGSYSGLKVRILEKYLDRKNRN